MNFLDIVILVFAAIYFFKGWKQGLIASVFKVIAYVLGILISMNFSSFVTQKLFSDNSGLIANAFPLISYLLLFSTVVGVVHLIGRWVSRAFSFSVLGLANKLSGAVLYLLVFVFIASTFIWIFSKMQAFNLETQANSLLFLKIQPIAPWVFENIGAVFPFFKDAFNDLNQFFNTLSTDWNI